MVKRSSASRRAYFAALLGATAIACQVVAGIERVDKVAGQAGEGGGPDATPDTAAADPCVHARPPDKPANDPAPTTEFPPFVVAIDRIILDARQEGGAAGFDLDGYCSCDNRPNAKGGPACVAKQFVCDADGGIDNQAASLFPSFVSGADPDELANVNERITQGKRTILVFIRGYNGMKDDREVEVGVAESHGIRTMGCPTSTQDAISGHWTPGWCGEDPWSVVPQALDTGTNFPVNYARGYVADGRIVVELDKSARIPFGDRGFEFGNSIFTATLVPLDEALMERPWERAPTENEKRLFKMKGGAIAGRLAVNDLLSGIGSIITPSAVGGDGGSHLCQNGLYIAVAGRVCEQTDIPQSKNFDTQAGYPCDAISTAVGFTAAPVRVGEAFKEEGRYNECEPTPENKPREPSQFVSEYTCAAAGDAGQ